MSGVPDLMLLVTACGPEVGFGHLARTTALAEHWLSGGGTVRFLANREAEGWLRHRRLPASWWSPVDQADRGQLLDGRPACLVVDLPARAGFWDEQRRSWLELAAARGTLGLAFEDRPGALPAGADLVVNPNAGAYPPAGGNGRYLAGTSFQPVRREFLGAERHDIRPTVEQVLVCVGGGENPLALEAAQLLARHWPRARQLICAGGSRRRWPGTAELVADPERLPELARRCDLAVVGGGQLKAEMACLGVPAVVLPAALDQYPSCRAWEANGAAVVWSLEGLAQRLERIESADVRRRLAAAGRRLVDGRGGGRIVTRLRQLLAERGAAA